MIAPLLEHCLESN